jgi:hypothetical protein
MITYHFFCSKGSMSALNVAEIEQTKLLANALDRASTACLTVGIATPVAAMLYGFGNATLQNSAPTAIYIAGWLIVAITLHYLARTHLRRLS